VLWIDAICINQGDAAERSSLVRRMKSIYENAKHVLIWLGPAGDDSSLAIAKISSIAGIYASAKTQLEMQGAPSEEAGNIAIDTITKKDSASIVMQSLAAPYDRDLWTALERLFKRPWWFRLCIIQEATTQVDTMFVCGNHVMDWKTLLCGVALFLRLCEQFWFSSSKRETLAGPIRLTNFRKTRHHRPQDLKCTPCSTISANSKAQMLETKYTQC
jgi:Heterokaryon incompatibility protein (HET)